MEFLHNKFSDIFSANELFVQGFQHSELTGTARKGLAIITCMDSRISPLAVVGMQAGDAKILRNAGARVTDDVLRTLVLASYLLGVNRVLVMPHTDCRMARDDEATIRNHQRTAWCGHNKFGISHSFRSAGGPCNRRQEHSGIPAFATRCVGSWSYI